MELGAAQFPVALHTDASIICTHEKLVNLGKTTAMETSVLQGFLTKPPVFWLNLVRQDREETWKMMCSGLSGAGVPSYLRLS